MPGMRYLGLDLGSRTIGLALSDRLGFTAQPIETWRRDGTLAEDLEHLRRLCEANEVDEFVLGLPLDGAGEVGRQARKVLEFARVLEETLGRPVRTWDERMSTRAVQRVLIDADVRRSKRKDVVDKLAAAYILQGFLDSAARERRESEEEGR